ncbi:AlpA family phage regulatory protein [Marinobacter sp. EVN1]|uniref:helix-turn-helix transcriptional regulator n=1 Tax=Marinobacter sp. EVN1 TaxID=1397532 RepID=UPI0009DC0EB7
MKSDQKEKYLSARELASRYEVSLVTPWRWAKQGSFPRPVKLGPNCTRWKLSEIEAWEASRGVTA